MDKEMKEKKDKDKQGLWQQEKEILRGPASLHFFAPAAANIDLWGAWHDLDPSAVDLVDRRQDLGKISAFLFCPQMEFASLTRFERVVC